MASRTSVYTNALNLPRWVLNGEFGDLSNVMNNRDISYENTAQEEIATDSANLKLEDAQRKERMREILQDSTAGQRPKTIRDAYEQMINAAYDAGDPIAAMEYEGKRQAYEDAQLAKQRAALTGAIAVADNLGYDRVNEYFPGVLTREDYDKNQKRKNAERNRSSDMVVVMNTETGAKDRIPWSMAETAQQRGWEVDPTSSRQQEIMDQIRRRNDEMENPPKPGFFSRILNPTAAETTPAPRSSATPLPQDGRGDRARQMPAVGEEVKIIKQKRSVKGK